MFKLSKYGASGLRDEKTATCGASTKNWASSMSGMKLLCASEDSLRAVLNPESPSRDEKGTPVLFLPN